MPLLFAVLCSVGLAAIAPAAVTPTFMRGISGCGDDASATADLRAIGATHVRRYAMWRYVEPELRSVNESLTVDYLRAHPEEIRSWAAGIRWEVIDRMMHSALAANVTPVPEVTEGTIYGLPRFNGTIADPGIIGIGPYLAYQYRWVRALVSHLNDASGLNLGLKLFQIENELNEAALEGLYGQRLPTKPWGNWTFLTELLTVLRTAVKDADSTADVTMNFHTDIPEAVHQFLGLRGFYLDAVRDWAPLLDVLSIDAYPNMYAAQPLLFADVGTRVAKTLAVVNGTKNVFVMETGFPVNRDDARTFPNNDTALPPVLNFSFANQAAYAEGAVAAVRGAGGSGLFYFDMSRGLGMVPPTGGYTAADVGMLREIREFLARPNVSQILHWLVDPPAHLVEVVTRAGAYMSRPDGEHGWGILAHNGTRRPAFDALAAAFARV